MLYSLPWLGKEECRRRGGSTRRSCLLGLLQVVVGEAETERRAEDGGEKWTGL